MFRIDTPDSVATPPATLAVGTPGYFWDGNEATGALATTVTPDWLNTVQTEIETVIVNAGLVLQKTDRTQLWQALQRLIAVDLSPYVLKAGDTMTGDLHTTAIYAPYHLAFSAAGTWFNSGLYVGANWSNNYNFGVDGNANLNVYGVFGGTGRFAFSVNQQIGMRFTSAGGVFSNGGRVFSVVAGGWPSVGAWDPNQNMAWGFWVDSNNGNFGFGQTDGAGNAIGTRFYLNRNTNCLVNSTGNYMAARAGGNPAMAVWDTNSGCNAIWTDASANLCYGDADGNGYPSYTRGYVSRASGALVHLASGRIVGQGWSPSITAYNTSQNWAGGFWFDQGVWIGDMYGDGTPARGNLYVQDGLVTVEGQLNTTGNLSINGGAYVNGSLGSGEAGVYAFGNHNGAVLNQTGVNYRNWGGDEVAWHFTGQFLMTWVNGNQWGIVRCGGAYRVDYLDMSGNSGTSVDFDQSRWYWNTFRSDPKVKRDIAPCEPFDSLEGVRSVPIKRFRWKRFDDEAPVPFGFISTDLKKALPGTVITRDGGSLGDLDHAEPLPLIAHLFRAVQQIADRLDHLEQAKEAA